MAVFHGIHAPCFALFEFRWADLAQRRMSAPLVIEHLDVVEQGLLRVRVAFEALALFTLHRREPALHDDVVVTISATTHRARDAVLLESGPIVFAHVRAALIGVMQEAGVGTAPLQGRLPRAKRQVPIIHGTECSPRVRGVCR